MIQINRINKGFFANGDFFKLSPNITWRNIVELNKMGAGVTIPTCTNKNQLFRELSKKHSQDKVQDFLKSIKFKRFFRCYYHDRYPKSLYGKFSDIRSFIHNDKKRQRKEFDLNPNMGWLLIFDEEFNPVGRTAVINGNHCAVFSAPFGLNIMPVAAQLARKFGVKIKKMHDRVMGGLVPMIYGTGYKVYNPSYPRYAHNCALCNMISSLDYCNHCQLS